VIYLPDSEAEWIPEDEKWRQLRYEYGSDDWTHEREWRLPGDLDLTKILAAITSSGITPRRRSWRRCTRR
jgi:hypothetical protein